MSLSLPSGGLVEPGRLWQLLALETAAVAALLTPVLIAISLFLSKRGHSRWTQRGALWGLCGAVIVTVVISTLQRIPRMGWEASRSSLLQLAALFLAACWGAFVLMRVLGKLRPSLSLRWLPIGAPLLAVGLSLAVLATSWSRAFAHLARPARSESTPKGVRHVVLVTVDTLRPDFLRVYNPDAPETPALERFAKDAIVYDNAMTLSPWTKPSLATILTGQAPSRHKVVSPYDALDRDFVTVTERLLDAGYYTGLIGFNPYFDRTSQFDQGFVDYYGFPRGSLGHSLAAELVARFSLPIEGDPGDTKGMTRLGRRWLGQHAQQPFFLWMHYYDPHQPYQPPDKFMPKGEPPSEELRHFREFKEVRGGYAQLTAEERSWIRSLYAGEVQHADENVGELLEEMKSLGIYDDALIVFASDHGEEFWEHGGFEHGHALYEEVMRVPLMVKPPGNGTGTRVSQRVSLMSVYPTLLAAAKIEAEDGLPREPPLTDPVVAGARERAFVGQALLYYEDKVSVTDASHKYIRSLVTGQEEVYDLSADPGELESLTRAAPDLGARLRQRLDDQRALDSGGQPEDEARTSAPAQVDPAMLENLRALGYAQ